MLEKAVKPQFFLLVSSSLIFTNSVLAYFSGESIRDILTCNGGLNALLAIKIVLIFVVFSGLVSLMLPSLMVIVVVFYIEVQYLDGALFMA